MHLMETHCHMQRRWYASQLSLTRTPLECEEAQQRLSELYNTTAHQGLLQAPLASPIPLHVLGEATGRLYTPRALERTFSCARFPRTTNRSGCVTLHRYHFSVDQGWPQKPGVLWVYGNALRAVFDNVLVAAYHCHYALREDKVTDIRDGSLYPSPFASCQKQGSLIPLKPQESLVLYR